MKTPLFTIKVFFLIILIITILSVCKGEIQDPNVIKQGQYLNISIEDLTEDVNYFFAIVDDIYMEVLVVITPEGDVRAAFNTCERCHVLGKGYFLFDDDDEFICNQCKSPIYIENIGLSTSGCHPIPITNEEKTITEDSILIPYETLSVNTHWFLNWKIEEEPELEIEIEAEAESEPEDSDTH